MIVVAVVAIIYQKVNEKRKNIIKAVLYGGIFVLTLLAIFYFFYTSFLLYRKVEEVGLMDQTVSAFLNSPSSILIAVLLPLALAVYSFIMFAKYYKIARKIK